MHCAAPNIIFIDVLREFIYEIYTNSPMIDHQLIWIFHEYIDFLLTKYDVFFWEKWKTQFQEKDRVLWT